MKYFLKVLVSVASFVTFASGQCMKSSGTFKLGQYQRVNGSSTATKTYYLAQNFRDDWMGAFEFCKSSGLDLLMLDDKAEADNFLKLCNSNLKQFDSNQEAYVGAVSVIGMTEWFWFESGQKISFPLVWNSGEPNNLLKRENCASIKAVNGKFAFSDDYCYNEYKSFICQDVKMTASSG